MFPRLAALIISPLEAIMPNFISGNGKYHTKQLFYEMQYDLPPAQRLIDPVFSFHKDREGVINFGAEYVKLRDPTGYRMAQKFLANYNHWQALMSCRWFVAAKEIWDKELDALLKAESLEQIRMLAEEGMPAQRLAAAKYLANAEYRKDHTSTKGRPRKEDVDRAARQLAEDDKSLQEDLKRIKGAKD